VLKHQQTLSARIIARLLGRGDPKKIAASLPIWTESLPASKLLYTAIDEFDRGQFHEAWLYARRAWRAERTYPDAPYWVGRMHYYLLQYLHARRYYEQFVYEHTTHPRTGDAVIEYLDTYERATVNPRACADEIGRILDRIPSAARVSFHHSIVDWNLLHRDLKMYLEFRIGRYLMTTTEYPRAVRTIAHHFARHCPEAKRAAAVNVLHAARMKTGQVLRQPTSLRTLVDAPPLPEHPEFYNFVLGCAAQLCGAGACPTFGCPVNQDWYLWDQRYYKSRLCRRCRRQLRKTASLPDDIVSKGIAP